jgi:hypothetical protein
VIDKPRGNRSAPPPIPRLITFACVTVVVTNMNPLFLAVVFFFVLPAYSGDSVAEDPATSVKSPYGVLSIVGDFQQNHLLLDGKRLELPGGDSEYASLSLIGKYSFGDRVAVLISDSQGGSCQLYRFVTLGQKSHTITPAFGTCDDGPKISQDGEKISLQMRDEKGKKVRFLYSEGKVTQNGKVVR